MSEGTHASRSNQGRSGENTVPISWGDMMVETVRAKSDGIITPAEAQLLRKKLRDCGRLQAKIDDVLASVVSREGDA